MYSDKKSVLQLVALLKAHGITQIVLSPGSRNSPLSHSFVTDSDFTCYGIVDERSAGFFALGVIQATGKPVAVCCTSGTAVLNLGPAMAEAFYQQLPLLAVTADRPSAWIGQMDGQTIPQEGVFKGITRRSVHLPQITDDEEEWYCNRLINEAILSMDNGTKGPSHINIPLGEPLFGFNVANLPAVRVIRQSKPGYVIRKEDGYDERFAAHIKRMVIVGQLPPGNGLDGLLMQLRERWDVVVLTEQLSNLPANGTAAFDTVLYAASEEMLQKLTPDLVISLGGHIVSKRLKKFIRSADIREHWHISPSGEVADTFQRVTDIIKSDAQTFLRFLVETPLSTDEKDFGNQGGNENYLQSQNEINSLGQTGNNPLGQSANDSSGQRINNPLDQTTNNFRKIWENACASIHAPEAAFSDLFAVGALMHALPKNASLHVGNSNSVRLAQLFSIPTNTLMFCNRGTNGIEGSLSTAVGYSAASGNPTFLLIGDLSFFYDMNGIWNRHVSRNLRILLNNNGGGEIFGMLAGLDKSEALHGYIAASHTTEAKAWAEQQGFLYLSARNAEELHRHLPVFLDMDSPKPVLLEVFTSMEKNAEQIRAYYHQQKISLIVCK